MKTMRKLSFLLAVAMVLSLFPVMAVNAAEPGYVFDFYYESDFDDLYPASNLYCCDVTWEDNALKLVAENVDELGDPYFYLNSIGAENMEASDYPYAAFCLKNLTDAVEFEGHFGTTLHTVSGSTVFHFDIDANMTEYKTYIVNMPVQNQINVNRINGPDSISAEEGATANLVPEMEEGETAWEGEVTQMRFDGPYKGGRSGLAEDGDTMYIAWVAFFETEEDAKNYAGPDHSTERTPEPTKEVSEEDMKPYGLMVFDHDDDLFLDFFSGNNRALIEDVYYNDEKKCWSIDIAQGGDPSIELGFGTMSYSGDIDTISADDYKVLQIALRVNTDEGNKNGSLYYQTTEHTGYKEAQNIIYNYQKTDDVQCLNIDFSKAAAWADDVENCRFDMFVSSAANTTIDIYYLAFFANKAAAEAFAAEYLEKGAEALPTAAPTPTKAPTAVPTEVPVTDVPATKAPATDVPATDAPKATEENTAKDNSNGGNKWIVPVVIVAAVAVAAAIAGIVIAGKKKKG